MNQTRVVKDMYFRCDSRTNPPQPNLIISDRWALVKRWGIRVTNCTSVQTKRVFFCNTNLYSSKTLPQITSLVSNFEELYYFFLSIYSYKIHHQTLHFQDNDNFFSQKMIYNLLTICKTFFSLNLLLHIY